MRISESTSHSTRAVIHLDRLGHNLRLLSELAGGRPLWPAIKANAYGHGAGIVARHLTGLGYGTLCVAHVEEAAELIDSGLDATFLVLSAARPEQASMMADLGVEPVVCTTEMAHALDRAARAAGKRITVHIKVDTGMGRIGVSPEETPAFIEACTELPGLRLRGLMSHFPRADEGDSRYSQDQIQRFRAVTDSSRAAGIEVRHMANSAAIFDLPDSHFDAVRPGISIYGLRPSADIVNPRVGELRPVLEWKTRIAFLKEVPAGTGLSYGHTFQTAGPSLIATVPVGYGDGLSRRLSNGLDILVGGARCPQVGTVTMDQTLIDVTAVRGEIALDSEAVIIGKQGADEITADEIAGRLGTINYEIVTAISARVAREAAPTAD